MEYLIGTLMFGKFGLVLAIAYLSTRGLEKLKDEGQRKSSLSRDGIQERLQAVASTEQQTT